MAPIAIQELQHDHVEPDPRNPRQACNEEQLTELANDIAVRGVLQPIVVRPHPDKKGRFMIVFGERRWRAAGMVDAETVPCIIRQYDSELAVLEDQIAENGKRADVHPLEEADAYRRLHEEHGREVDEIAELTGKSKAYVYAAMKLCALTAEPRRAFLAGKFDKSVALLIARLPVQQQAPATKHVLNESEESYLTGSSVMSYREAKDYIRDEFMLRLATAPFKVADAELVPKAGACTTCPKRTGNQRELFDDVVSDKHGGADVCTDAPCFRAKVDVHWSRIAAAAKEKGRAVIEGQAAERAGSYGDKFVRLDDRCFEDPKDRTYRQLLGKNADDAVSAVARGAGGQVKELVEKAELPKLLKEAGVKLPKESSGRGKAQADYDREAKEQKQLEAAVTQAARDAVLAKLDDAGDVLLWRLLARLAVRVARNDAQRELVKLHELKTEGDGHYKGGFTGALLDYVEGLPVRAARDFAVEALLAEAGGWREDAEDDYTNEGMTPEELAEEKAERRSYMTGLEHAAEVFKLDVPAIAEQARKDLADAAKAKAEKKAGSKAIAGVDVPGSAQMIGMDTEEIRSLYTKVFGVETKRDREWMTKQLGKRHNELHPISDEAKAMLAKQQQPIDAPAAPSESKSKKPKKNGVAPAAEAT